MKSQVFLLLVFASLVTSKHSYPCITPNDEYSYCTSLFSCPHLMTLIGSLEPFAIEFVKKSLCFTCSSDDVMVCCGSSQNNVPFQEPDDTGIMYKLTVPTKTNDSVKRALLPSKRYCGFQHTDDRFYEDTATALDEYPWLVSIASSLKDETPGYEVRRRCNGVLISNRYVLTHSYCGFSALKVKLGQYNTHENKSCVESSADFEECADQPVEIRIEEKIKEGEPWSEPYNFALLRLAKPVHFTDFIRPICLPLEEDKSPEDLRSIIFSGWGTENETAIVKKRLFYNIIDDEICYGYAEYLRDIAIRAQLSFICAVENINNTNTGCGGDTGGPFMYSKRHQWFVGGSIIDVFSCNNTAPVTGLRITQKTINWILTSIRP